MSSPSLRTYVIVPPSIALNSRSRGGEGVHRNSSSSSSSLPIAATSLPPPPLPPITLVNGIASVITEHWPKYRLLPQAVVGPPASSSVGEKEAEDGEGRGGGDDGVTTTTTTAVVVPCAMSHPLYHRLRESVSVVMTRRHRGEGGDDGNGGEEVVVAHANFTPPSVAPSTMSREVRDGEQREGGAASGITQYPLVPTTVYFVVVRASERGKGMGKVLMDTVEAVIRQMGHDDGVEERGDEGAECAAAADDDDGVAPSSSLSLSLSSLSAVFQWAREVDMIPTTTTEPPTAAAPSSLVSLPRLPSPVDVIRLETPDQQAFYERCGYRVGRTAQLTTDRPVFGAFLQQKQLDGLNKLFGGGRGSGGGGGGGGLAGLFAARGRGGGGGASSSAAAPSALASSSSSSANVWLMKMLREEGREPFILPKLFVFGGGGGSAREDDTTTSSGMMMPITDLLLCGVRAPTEMLPPIAAGDAASCCRIARWEGSLLASNPNQRQQLTSILSSQRQQCCNRFGLLLNAIGVEKEGVGGGEEKEVEDQQAPAPAPAAALASYHSPQATSTTSTPSTCTSHDVIAMPWQRQIGPTCGLSLLRMLREWLVGMMTMQQAKTAAINVPPSLVNVYLSCAKRRLLTTTTTTAAGEGGGEPSAPCLGEVLDTDLLADICNEYFADVSSRADGAVQHSNNTANSNTHSINSTCSACTVRVKAETVQLMTADGAAEMLLRSHAQRRQHNNATANSASASSSCPSSSSSLFSFLLVPYDRDATEQPSTTTNGARAHWGIVVGVLEGAAAATSSASAAAAAAAPPLALVQHGAHSDLVLAPIADLIASNAQLTRMTMVDPKSGEPTSVGLEGLRGRAVKVTVELLL